MTPPITSGLSAGISGMQAARLRLDSSAHNVANVMTPDFRRQVVSQTARPDQGGVDARLEPTGAGGFDRLAEDLVQQKLGLYSFEASLRTVQAHDDMLGTLLDIRA
ncbi:MAG: flagellar basal body rod protein [Burkholderiaceae bacterium]